MRDVIFAINTTLDGCCDHTKTFADDEVLDYHTRLLEEADLLVFGRITYELMVPYWPEIARAQSDAPAALAFACAFDAIPKVVFSRSLASAEDGNTRIARGNLRDTMLQWKREPGKSILVGGVNLPVQLIELGLVDEYRFVVGPILAGAGRRLMEGVNLPEKLHLKLVEATPLPSGCVALRYAKR